MNMKIRNLYSILLILGSFNLSLGQNSNKTVSAKIKDNINSTSTYSNLSTTLNDIKETSIDFHKEQQDSNEQIISKQNQLPNENSNQLPQKIINKLSGFNTLNDLKHENDSNIICIKTLLANIYYPTDYNINDYYNIVCNDNTSIKELKFLRETIERDNNVCESNGPNYKTAYNLIKLNHYLNCIKDEDGNYCYEFYKELYNQTTTNKSNYYWDTLKSKFARLDNTPNDSSYEVTKVIDFCPKTVVFANDLARKMIKDDFDLELYYNSTDSYTISIKKYKDYQINKLEECKASDIKKFFIENKNNEKYDINLKKLIKLYEENSSNYKIHLNKIIISKFVFIFIITIYILL